VLVLPCELGIGADGAEELQQGAEEPDRLQVVVPRAVCGLEEGQPGVHLGVDQLDESKSAVDDAHHTPKVKPFRFVTLFYPFSVRKIAKSKHKKTLVQFTHPSDHMVRVTARPT